MHLVIIDSGCANVASVAYGFERLGVKPVITAERATIEEAGRLVLPGVGTARWAMQALEKRGLTGVLKTVRVPLLGICLGMQLLFDRSEEGDAEGLGLLKGEVKKLTAAEGLTIPHMGWNRIESAADHPLLEGVEDGGWFYFAHSYAVGPGDATLATADHGQVFTAITGRGLVMGCQFHPERSGTAGHKLLQNFLEMPA